MSKNEMTDSDYVKNVIQFYCNIERLEVLNNKIERINSSNVSEIKKNIIIYNQTLQKVLCVYNRLLFRPEI